MSDNWADRATRTYTPPDNTITDDERLWWSFVNPCTDEQGAVDYQSVAERMAQRIAELESQGLPAAFMRAEQRVQQVEAENRALRERVKALMAFVAAFDEPAPLPTFDEMVEARQALADAGFGTEWGTERER